MDLVLYKICVLYRQPTYRENSPIDPRLKPEQSGIVLVSYNALSQQRLVVRIYVANINELSAAET